ncbi:unnamed protein product, partial [Sphagnum balticum]
MTPLPLLVLKAGSGSTEKLETHTEDHDSTFPRSLIVLEKTVAGYKKCVPSLPKDHSWPILVAH